MLYEITFIVTCIDIRTVVDINVVLFISLQAASPNSSSRDKNANSDARVRLVFLSELNLPHCLKHRY